MFHSTQLRRGWTWRPSLHLCSTCGAHRGPAFHEIWGTKELCCFTFVGFPSPSDYIFVTLVSNAFACHIKTCSTWEGEWETQVLSQWFSKTWNCRGGGRALNGSFLLVAAVRLSLAAEQQVIQLILAMFFSGLVIPVSEFIQNNFWLSLCQRSLLRSQKTH